MSIIKETREKIIEKLNVFSTTSKTQPADKTTADIMLTKPDNSKQEPAIISAIKPATKPIELDINRILLFDILVHPLDLLANSHMESSSNTDICIKEITLNRTELTTESLVSSIEGDRLPISVHDFGDILADKISYELFKGNSLKIATLLDYRQDSKEGAVMILKIRRERSIKVEEISTCHVIFGETVDEKDSVWCTAFSSRCGTTPGVGLCLSHGVVVCGGQVCSGGDLKSEGKVVSALLVRLLHETC
eukprot:gene3797-7546_t